MSLLSNLLKSTRPAETPRQAGGLDEVWCDERSPDLLHQKLSPCATYSPWLGDQAFLAVAPLIHSNTMVDLYRCHELWSLAQQVKEVPGCFLEVGVWRGGTGALIAAAARASGQRRTVYLADTFKGVVKAGEQDTRYLGGEHADTAPEMVSALVESLGLTDVRILRGIFPDATAQLVDQPVAFLHCDVDVYQSSKDIVEWVQPRMSSGGVIVFDDYGGSGCEGVTRYVNELSAGGGFYFIYNLNGHAVCIKK